MIALYKNQLFELEMPWRLFQSLKKSSPDSEVKLLKLTDSSYKEQVSAPLGEVDDWTIVRNMSALGRN